MIHFRLLAMFIITATAVIALSGCKSLPPQRAYAETADIVASRMGAAPDWSADRLHNPAVTLDIPDQVLTVNDAIRIAFVNNPRILQAYARLGLGRAELEEARRLPNPEIGYERMDPRDVDGTKTTRSLSLAFADLLLLPARQRLASSELERLQNTVASELLELANEVENAWFEALSATQIAAMRNAVVKAADNSAALAQRTFNADDLNRAQLEKKLNAARQARILAVRADVAALRKRHILAELLGLPINAPWRILEQLPSPPETVFRSENLLTLALEQRLDLIAAKHKVSLREDVFKFVHRWRWLGAADFHYERETDINGSVKRGPTLSLALPLFNQGQGAVMRAQSELIEARAELDTLTLAVNNDVELGMQSLNMARDIAEQYRKLLTPEPKNSALSQQETTLDFSQLTLAEQEDPGVYQEYIEAIRDYWRTRVDLKFIVGGRLPDDNVELKPTLGLETIFPSTPKSASDISSFSP